MTRKQIIYIVLIAFFVGAFGSIIISRFAIPYLATFKGLSGLNKLSSASPIVINRTEQVQLNEGVNLIDLIKQAGNITVTIYGANNNFLGNGLIATTDGLVFTSSDILQKQSQFVVMTNDGQKFSATRNDKVSFKGLALLTIQASGLATSQFDSATGLQPGHRVIYLGRGNVKFEHEAVSGIITQSLANQLDNKQIASDAVLNSDYFGGPIINLTGHVVGLVVNSSKNIIAEDLQDVLNKYLAK
jgi:S1-C subfamily serine protease